MSYKTLEILELGEIVRTIVPPKKIQTSEYLPRGSFPIVDQSVPEFAGWTNDESALVHPNQDGLIVFGDHTCILKFLTRPFAQGADGIKIIEVKSGINAHYVYSHLSAFPLLNDGYKRHFSELKRLRIRLPDFPIQNAISSIRRKFDSKIAINSAISKTLELIAQTIFKSWFVDFDPVHAKAEGEQPEGMDTETVALFPDSFEDSELGAIPAGWRQGVLRDLAELNFGVPFKSKLFSSQSVGRPVIRIRDLAKGFSETYTTEIHPKEHVTAQGDLLIGMDGTFDAVVWLGPQSLVNQRVAIVSPHSFTSQLFLKFAIQKELKLLEANATGTTVGHLSKGEIESLKVVRASIELMEKYKDSVEPVLAQMANLASQNRTLQELRDSLLPRLISGELEIPEDLLGE